MKRTKNHPLKNILSILIISVHMLPIYITVVASLTKLGTSKSYLAVPNALFTENYRIAMETGNLLPAILNTLFITVCSVVLVILLGATAAFPLARVKTKLNQGVMFGIISLMMIPPLSLLVPLYSFMKTISAIDTYWGIILLHVVFQMPTSIFLFRNFIASIPKELDEAATIDGCNIVQLFFKVILPNVKPVIATVTILTGVGVWNDYQFSLYFLQSPEKRVLTLAISQFFSQGDVNLNVAASAAILGVIPIGIAYLFLQKYFIRGMVDSAVK